MNLQQILNYQDVDRKLYALQKELATCQTAQKINYYTNTKNDAATEILKNIRILDEQMANFEKNKKSYEEINHEVKEIIDVCNSFEELKEVDFYEKKINQMLKELESIEREIIKNNKSIEEINKICKTSIANGMKCVQELSKLKLEYEEFKKSIESKIVPLKEDILKLEAGIGPDILEKYNQIRKLGKIPVLVKFNEKDKSCSGCNMNIDYNLLGKLEEGVIECPNCSRIVYKDKK